MVSQLRKIARNIPSYDFDSLWWTLKGVAERKVSIHDAEGQQWMQQQK